MNIRRGSRQFNCESGKPTQAISPASDSDSIFPQLGNRCKVDHSSHDEKAVIDTLSESTAVRPLLWARRQSTSFLQRSGGASEKGPSTMRSCFQVHGSAMLTMRGSPKIWCTGTPKFLGMLLGRQQGYPPNPAPSVSFKIPLDPVPSVSVSVSFKILPDLVPSHSTRPLVSLGINRGKHECCKRWITAGAIAR